MKTGFTSLTVFQVNNGYKGNYYGDTAQKTLEYAGLVHNQLACLEKQNGVGLVQDGTKIYLTTGAETDLYNGIRMNKSGISHAEAMKMVEDQLKDDPNIYSEININAGTRNNTALSAKNEFKITDIKFDKLG